MRGSFRKAVPVTADPYPSFVRQAIHHLIRSGYVFISAEQTAGTPGLWTVVYRDGSATRRIVVFDRPPSDSAQAA